MSAEANSAMHLMEPGQGWIIHPDFPDYMVGVHGAVISLRGKAPRILSPIKMGQYDGYQIKNADDVLVRKYRHRLVAEVVYGPCPEGQECRHLDGNKRNADFTNLIWGTRQENSADKILHGTRRAGELHPGAKLTAAQVIEMRAARADGMTFKEISERHGVTIMTTHRAVTGKSWRAI